MPYNTPLERKKAGKKLVREMSKKLLEARKKLKRAIIEKSAEPDCANSVRARTELYKEITGVYNDLQAELSGDIGKHLEKVALSADSEVRDTFGAKRKESLVKFSSDRMTRYFEMVNPENSKKLAAVMTDKMSANAISKLRNSFVEVYRRGAVEGLTTNELQRELQSEWDKRARNENTYRFVDRSGRAWSNANYLQMLVTTNSERIWRESYMDTCAENKIDLVMVSQGVSSDCRVCAEWQGRVLSLSGATKGFPTYSDALTAGMFHPNCTHRIEAMDEDWDKDEIEKQRGR